MFTKKRIVCILYREKKNIAQKNQLMSWLRLQTRSKTFIWTTKYILEKFDIDR